MTERPTGTEDAADDAEDREAILRRRARFIATALGALAIGTASVQAGCDPEVTRETSSAGGDGGGGAPQPCLDVAPPDTSSSQSSGGGEGGMPQPCLGMPAEGGGGMGTSTGDVTSSTGGDAGAGGTGGAAPCLAPRR